MFETLFGAEMPLALRFFIAFIIVLALIGGTAYVVRRFGGDRLGAAASRGRQPRLAVVDAAAVDGRRRLLLIRRDNVEHLLMIGGPTDVLVEANIVRAPAATGRPPAAPETLPRAVPLGEGTMWPLQPEPASAPAAPAPALRSSARLPIQDEPAPWPLDEPAPPAPSPRPSRQADPLAGLAAELSRGPGQPDIGAPPPRPSRSPLREREPMPERPRLEVRPEPRPAPSEPDTPPAAEPPFASAADQNLAEMAHRLEAALRRPGARPKEPPPLEPLPEPMFSGPPHSDSTPRPAESKPAQPKNVYDSLEQEMASLLGRPNDKS
jgi:flagellar protein FliO/FliZ